MLSSFSYDVLVKISWKVKSKMPRILFGNWDTSRWRSNRSVATSERKGYQFLDISLFTKRTSPMHSNRDSPCVITSTTNTQWSPLGGFRLMKSRLEILWLAKSFV